jgi:uncharacterized membrane protein YfcA
MNVMGLSMDVLSLLSGVLVGFVLGLIGGGGSVFAAPLLVYFVGVSDVHIAIGTSSLAVAANALVNLLGHARAGHVKWRCASVFAASGVLGAMVGSTLGKHFDGQKLLLLFGMLMIVIAAQMFFKKPAEHGHEIELNARTAPRMAPALVLYGLGVGLLSGFFGIGGGFLVVPGILAATGMPILSAIGSSLLSVTAFGATTAANYAFSSMVDWRIAGFLLAGGVVGGLGGGVLAAHLAVRRQALSRVFSVLVAGVGCYVVFRGALVLLGH